MTRVKICGITNSEDARAALDAGADAIGLVFAKSPRRVSVKQAEEITRALGPWIAPVGVFVNASPDDILHTVRECRLSAVQLHGDETPADILKLKGVRVIKAFRVGEDLRPVTAQSYQADAYLFDTKVPGIYGGSGKSFDWSMLKAVAFDRPVIVSGGLDPKNVAKAIRAIRPYGVDVSSGVESAPGKKNAKLIKEFIRNAKKA